VPVCLASLLAVLSLLRVASLGESLVRL